MAASKSGEIVKKVIDEVLEYIEKNDPESFQKLNADGSKKDELIAEIRHIVECEISHGEELKSNGEDVTKLNLPPGRLAAIKDGLKMATYRVEVGHDAAKLTFPDGTDFKTIQLDTRENIDAAYYVQVASIIIEGVLLVLQIIGIEVSVSKTVMERASDELVEQLETSSAFQEAVKKFVDSWDNASSYTNKAMALFYLLKDTYSLGILWNLIKLLCSDMTWWDWTKAAAVISAQLIAALATDGLALIAKIALALKSAYDFTQKIANLNTLNLQKK